MKKLIVLLMLIFLVYQPPVRTEITQEIPMLNIQLESRYCLLAKLKDMKLEEVIQPLPEIVDEVEEIEVVKDEKPAEPVIKPTEPIIKPVEPKPVEPKPAEPIITPVPKEEPKPVYKNPTYAEWRQDILKLTNIERAKVGVSPLIYSYDVEYGAQIRAEEIIDNFSHTRPDGSRFFTVLPNLDYRYIGENLALGYKSPEEVVAAWMRSDGHRENMLASKYQYLGVGIAKDDDGRYRWVQIFYTPKATAEKPNLKPGIIRY